MRKSRVLLAGVATSAFTASNTVPASVAGTGAGAVTGATITDIHYVTNAADSNKVDAIELTSTTDLTTKTTKVTMTTTGTVVGTPYSCAVKTAWDTTVIVMTCNTTGSTRTFDQFDSVSVTV